jgi:hypothetical protein
MSQEYIQNEELTQHPDESTDSPSEEETEAGEIDGDGNNAPDEEGPGDFSEQVHKLPIWKQIVLLIICMGALTAVIMLIDFLIEFFIAITSALLK